jgi:nucleoid-associated protein YgaU
MKVKVNREIAIGLSVLLLLTVILVVVTVWRLTRRAAHSDNSIAQLEEPRQEHRGKEVAALRPTFAEPTPTPATEAGHEYDSANRWEPRPQAKHEDKAAHVAEQAVKAGEAQSPPSLAKQDRYDAAHHESAAGEPAALPTEVADDRYGVPPAGRADAGAARPMVIQVSGDSPSNPARQRDVRGHVERGVAQDNRQSYGEKRNEAQQPRDYAAAGRAEVEAADNRTPTPATLPPNELPSAAANYAQPNNAETYNAQPNYPAHDPRYGYETTASAQQVDNVQPGYPGPGYARAEAPRREEFQQTMPQNPLRSDGMYEVLPNDSYWTISQRVYGSGAYFKALAELNRGKAARPDRLSPGLLISTPPVAQLEKDYPDFCPRPNRREAVRNHAAATASLAAYTGGRTYVVQEGDTLSSIARNELGKVSRWADIYQLNREALGKDYDYLTPGMKLALPPTESQSPDRTARRLDVAPQYNR